MNKQYFSFFLFTLFVVLYLVPLAVRPLIIPDETRYAEIPREMVATGDWIVPRLNGVRYFEKPVMGYWMTAVCLSLFGENNFAVRLPQALSTGFTALLIFFLCARLKLADSPFAWLAVLVYLTSLSVVGIGTFAVLDPLLSLFLTATLIFFFLATEAPPGSSRERVLLLVVGIMAGFAFLIKGFLAFVIPAIVAAPYLLIQRRWRDILRVVWLPIVGAVLVSLPWVILIHLKEPDFWHHFFWNEHIRRFLSDSAQHRHPFWIFAVSLPGMFLPWTLLLPAAVIALLKKQWSRHREYRLFVFSLCWFSFPFVFFSLAKGKLITYILPCLPPLAILFSMGLNYAICDEKLKKYFQYGIGLAGLLSILALLTLVELFFFWPDRAQVFNSTDEWLLLGGGFAAMVLLLVLSFRSRKPLPKIILFTISFTTLYFVVHFTMPSLTLQRKAPGTLISRHAKNITPQTYVLSGPQASRAVCWYLKRQDIYLVGRAGELQYGLNFKDNLRKLLSPAEAAEFIRIHPGQVVLIADYQEYEKWQRFLPPHISIDSNGDQGFVLVHF